jgi:hypothetical protein
MTEFLSRVRPDHIMALVALVLAFIAGLTIWLHLHWQKDRRMEIEAALKKEMLQRGMSADDIERVLEAGLGNRPPAEWERVLGPK